MKSKGFIFGFVVVWFIFGHVAKSSWSEVRHTHHQQAR
jgi:hypothetical protein